MIVFEEARFYTTIELLGIAGSILCCCIGIKFLTMKNKMLEAARREDKSSSVRLITEPSLNTSKDNSQTA